MSWDKGKQESRNKFKNINQEILAIEEEYIEEEEAKILLYKFLRQNPSFATEMLMGVRLFPFQHIAIKSMMETDYFLGIWSRGMSKSFSTAVFALLDAILNQGVHIGIISKSFRQSKMIFSKMEDIAKSPKAAFLSQCITRTSKANDQWVMEIGTSKITALPLGDGEKLRGFRFERMIITNCCLCLRRF